MLLAGHLRVPSLFTCATLWLHEVGLGASLDPSYRQDNHLREMKGPFQGRTAGQGRARLQTWVGQAWKPVGTHRVALPLRPTFSFLEGGRASWPARLEGGGRRVRTCWEEAGPGHAVVIGRASDLFPARIKAIRRPPGGCMVCLFSVGCSGGCVWVDRRTDMDKEVGGADTATRGCVGGVSAQVRAQ